MSLRETTLELDAARAKYRGEIISKTAMPDYNNNQKERKIPCKHSKITTSTPMAT